MSALISLLESFFFVASFKAFVESLPNFYLYNESAFFGRKEFQKIALRMTRLVYKSNCILFQ